MDVRYEALIRGFAIFFANMFTVRWAIKSDLKHDEIYVIFIILAAIAVSHYVYKK
tara:strand:+ start:200 stop:364 length:165 start_codon:yes stop_codon:yes gene_type:complete